jgi:putative membrane protein
MRTIATVAAVAASCIAAPAFAQAMSPAEYVANAGAGDLYEITSSQIVLETTQDPKIREFANMMIEHHTKSTADVKAAAGKAGLKPMPPKLMPAQAEMIAQLRAETGAARDAAYLAQQKMAHDQALAIHQGYASEGKAAPLREAAAKIVPVVQHHIDMLKGM